MTVTNKDLWSSFVEVAVFFPECYVFRCFDVRVYLLDQTEYGK